MIPDERDQMYVPPRPDLRCSEHTTMCDVIHSLHTRVVLLEQKVKMMQDAIARLNVR